MNADQYSTPDSLEDIRHSFPDAEEPEPERMHTAIVLADYQVQFSVVAPTREIMLAAVVEYAYGEWRGDPSEFGDEITDENVAEHYEAIIDKIGILITATPRLVTELPPVVSDRDAQAEAAAFRAAYPGNPGSNTEEDAVRLAEQMIERQIPFCADCDSWHFAQDRHTNDPSRAADKLAWTGVHSGI